MELKRRIKIHRLSLKDYVANIYYLVRYRLLHALGLVMRVGSPEQKTRMRLTFCDYFESPSWGTTEDNRRWIVGEHWGPYHPDQRNVYFAAPEHREGRAFFSARYQPREFKKDGLSCVIPFAVSWLSTARSFRQQYGRFECRMTLPKEKGTWPAFWLWGPTWPPEIDITEAYGGATGKDVVYQGINIHYGVHPGKASTREWFVKIDNYKGIEKRFQEFALEWRPEGMYIYFNGIRVFQYTRRKVLDAWFNKPNTQMWMLVNHNLKPAGDDQSLYIPREEWEQYSSEFEVDYVRAYQFNDIADKG